MDVIALLEAMVRVPSPSREERAVAELLVARMQAAGLRAWCDEAGNAVGVVGNGPCQIVLLGHMDTVPGGPAVEVRDGKLYGRGAVDAKGALAVFAAVAALFARPLDPTRGEASCLPAGWQLVVIGAVEEEAATSKGARWAAGQWAPAACVIGEPSGWDGVTLGYKGRLLCDLELRQATAHTAGPGPAVAERAVDYWNAITAYCAKFNEGRDGAFAALLPSLREIRTSREGDEDVVRASFGFRLPPDLGPDELEGRLREICPNTDAHLSFRGHEATFVAERSSALVRAFTRAIREVGARPRYKHKTGTSDMNVVGAVWGCPILAYGPGDSALDHTPNEHVALAEVERAVQVLERALRVFMAEADASASR
jgi:LysW-gamma-L-lysine carboxypeptidase